MVQSPNQHDFSGPGFIASLAGAIGRLDARGLAACCVVVVVVSLLFCSSGLGALGADSGAIADSSSSASSSSSAGSSGGQGSRVLNGSARERATIQQSVRLVPPTPEKPLLNSGANVKQFNGQVQSSPGAPVYPAKFPAFAPQNQTPRRQIFRPILPARIVIERPHVPYTPPAPPKWNYTMTPRNGIMTWSPGYSSTYIAHPIAINASTSVAANTTATSASLSQKALDARVHAERLSPGTAAWTGTGIRKLSGPAAPPAVAALSATPHLLNEPSPGEVKKNISWEDWYKRICKVIYDEWIVDPACPGKATVRVTVWSGREIEPKILNFLPAEGVTRDAAKEKAFREVSLRAINSLQKTEILDFPVSPSRTKVVFDLDMNRSVNGPSGCVVAAFH